MMAGLAVFFTVFLSASGLLMAVATLIRGGINPTASPGWTWAWGALGLALVAAWQTAQRSEARRPVRWGEGLFFVAGLIVMLRLSLWSGYLEGNEIRVLLPNNLGDYALHASQTAFLVQQPQFPMPAQILDGAPFAYPFGINWVAAGLASNGTTIPVALTMTLTAAGLGLIGAAWSWSRGFGILLLLLNGGVAGFTFVHGWQWLNYQDALAWKSIALSMLGTQRGVVVGLAAGLLLLGHLRSMLSEGAATRPGLRLPGWVAALLYGSLPLFHLHSFAAISFIGVIAVAFRWRSGGWQVVRQLIPGGLVAAGFVWWVTGGLTLGRQGGWATGWWVQEGHSALGSLFLNIGFWPVAVGVLAAGAISPWVRVRLAHWRLWGLHRRDALVLFLPGAGLLALACAVYRFQPWPWDNTKFFVWAYLVIGTAACEALLRRAPLFVKLPVGLLLFLSGAVTLIAGLVPKPEGYGLLTRSELTAVGEGLSHLDTGERFLCSSHIDYQHPIMLQGGKVVAGYDGHLWSHGYLYGPKVEAVRRVLAGAEGWEADAALTGATLGFWGARESAAHPGPKPPWAVPSNLVVAAPGFSIYRLRPLENPTGKTLQQLWK